MSVQLKGSGTIGGLDEGLVVSGIVTSSTQINVGSNIKLGSAGVVTATSFSGTLAASNLTGALPAISGANLTGLVSVANQADNKLITCTGTSNALNAETNLTYNGTKLTLTGNSADPVVEFINTSGSANQGDVLKLRASGRGGGIDDTDILLITNNTDTRTFGVSNAGTVNTTGNIIMAAGKGIDFSATSGTPSNGGEILDDYEEGNFTASLGGLSNWSSYSVTGQGHYVKIGKSVHININFGNVDLNNSASGNVIIFNLPFVPFVVSPDCRGVTSNYMAHNVQHANDGMIHSFYINPTYGLRGQITKNNASWTSWDASNFTATGVYLDLSATYFTAS